MHVHMYMCMHARVLMHVCNVYVYGDPAQAHTFARDCGVDEHVVTSRVQSLGSLRSFVQQLNPSFEVFVCVRACMCASIDS
jgi:collagenase-like PrtC family protease